MAITRSSRAEISKSRSKKKPFKLIICDSNGEPIQPAQLLTTKINCEKNVRALLKWAGGASAIVIDKTGVKEVSYRLHTDGYKLPL